MSEDQKQQYPPCACPDDCPQHGDPDPRTEHTYSVALGLMVYGSDGKRWLRATANLPCVPRIGDWVYVGESLVTVQRIELRDVADPGPSIDALCESFRARERSIETILTDCDFTKDQGWT